MNGSNELQADVSLHVPSLTNGLVDKTVFADTAVPAFGFRRLGFFAERATDEFDRFDLVKAEDALGFVIPTFGATPALPAMHVQFAIFADGHLMHIHQTWVTPFGFVLVIDELDFAIILCRLAQGRFVFGLSERGCAGEQQNGNKDGFG